MESVYRSLLHEQSLAREDPSDVKLLSSLQYHKRDLKTTLETTRWQVECVTNYNLDVYAFLELFFVELWD